MIKVLAFGDVHADYPLLWAALRHAGVIDDQGQPTPPLLSGRYQAILVGDLIHPKTLTAYQRLIQGDYFDNFNPEHLQKAAQIQFTELGYLKSLLDSSRGNINIILGNHDDAAYSGSFELGSGHSTRHLEFHPEYGGLAFPPELVAWFQTFARDIQIGSTHFAHAGPLPSMAYYDEFFYGSRDHKDWFEHQPDLVQDCGYQFGVYGHTVMHDGIVLDEQGRFALIDALHTGQYLELLFYEDTTQKPQARVRSFI